MFKRKYKRSEWMEGLLQAEKMWAAGYTIHSYVGIDQNKTEVSFIDDDGQTVKFRATREWATGCNDYTYHAFKLSKI
jgi:hypothetical protein